MADADCVIVGGGPAGMMLGLLLTRAGSEVLVLEKHRDFLRDFRGDTVHPSTMAILHEIGLLDEFLQLPHQEVRELSANIGDVTVRVAEFGHLPVPAPCIAFMPQWDFLSFLATHSHQYPNFRLMMETEATDLLIEDGRVIGVQAQNSGRSVCFRAPLVVGADGRHSVIRERAGLEVRDRGAPMDVLWFRLTRRADESGDTMGRFDAGRIFIRINRGGHWQCGYVIHKGGLDELRTGGLEAFRQTIGQVDPMLQDRVVELQDWEAIKLLTVKVDRLARWWRPGLLCIGDAAHAMSPVGGVGINLAIQDAVAVANILGEVLCKGSVTEEHLRMVQRRRELPTRIVQGFQIAIQKRVIARVLGHAEPMRPSLPLRLIGRSTSLRRLMGRMLGLGVRPEHVRLAQI